MDIIENGVVTDNVGLNFYEPDSIIGQNHVYELSLLFFREYGPLPSFKLISYYRDLNIMLALKAVPYPGLDLTSLIAINSFTSMRSHPITLEQATVLPKSLSSDHRSD